MNKEQRTKLINIISKDCMTCEKYFDKSGNTCAIGAMVSAVVQPDSPIIQLLKEKNNASVSFLWTVTDLLHKHFGLTSSKLQHIQFLNDDSFNDTPQLRREAIIKYLNEITLVD